MLEQPHRTAADQLHASAFDTQHAPLAQSDNIPTRIGLDIFEDALLACLPGVTLGIGIELVRIDLATNRPDCRK